MSPPDALSRQETIVGLAARQALRAGVPLRRTELVRPEIIKRDEIVTIVYEVPGIFLTIARQGDGRRRRWRCHQCR